MVMPSQGRTWRFKKMFNLAQLQVLCGLCRHQVFNAPLGHYRLRPLWLLASRHFALLASTTMRAIVTDSEMMDRTRGLRF
jgi:hypothetical protein